MSGVLERECTEVKERKVYGYHGDYIFETLRKTGDFYEVGTLEKWTPYIEKPEVILDVGANLGNHTLYWEKKLGAKKIFSFEPYGPNYENLVFNIQANNLENVVTPIMKAVGKHGGKVKLENVDQTNFGGTTFQYADGEKDEYTEIISIDDFARENGVKRIGLIKVDTEGFEIDVLQGAVNTIRRDRPIIWVEVGSQTHKQVKQMLEGLQYDLADVEAFNMLFISNEKNKKNIHVSNDKLLDAMFQYETKVNLYYKNYETAKRWYEDSRQKADVLRTEGQKLHEQLIAAEQNYEKAKEWHQASQTKNEALAAANEQLTKKLEATEQNYQKAKEWHQASQTKNEALAAANEQLTKLLEAKERDYQNVSEENQASIAKLSALQEETSRQTAKLAQEEQVIESLKISVQKADENKKRLEEQIDRDKEQIDQLKTQFRNQRQNAIQLQDQLDQYTGIVARYVQCVPSEIEVTEAFVQQLEHDRQTKERYAGLIAQFVTQNKSDEAFVHDIMRHVNKLQAQVNYLKKENGQYRAKLDKITSVWYGRLGIKAYKALKKIRAYLKDIFKR